MSAAPEKKTLFVLIDIDNTLYNYKDTGFDREIHNRIDAYAEEHLHIPHDQLRAVSYKYYLLYGTSLRGFVEDYQIDPQHYTDYIHQCSYEKLHHNAPLVGMLTRLQYQPDDGHECDEAGAGRGVDHLYYFTNANRPHARQVLTPLGLKPVFTRVRPASSPVHHCHTKDDPAGFEEDVEWLGFSYEDQWRLSGDSKANKPMKKAYEAIYAAIEKEVAQDAAFLQSEATGNGGDSQKPAPHAATVESKQQNLAHARFVMVDDSLANLKEPLALGWSVVWHAHDAAELPADQDKKDGCDYTAAIGEGRMQVIHSILELEGALEKIRLTL